jgi:nucleoside-diphosphate-sugar epimerase
MILVTGGTGLVGGHLLYRFRESELHITAIYRNKEHIAKTRAIFESYATGDGVLVDRFNWVQADVTEQPSLEPIMNGVTHIYHCAALIEDTFAALKHVNVMGTENLVNVALHYGVQKFCYVSSIATLGEPVGDRPINEEDFFNLDGVHSHYAISKYGGEMEVWRASQEGLDVIIVNPGVILGEGNWGAGSGKLFSKTASGQPFYTSGSSGFVDVQDVVDVMQHLMESDVVNERFILVAANETYKNVLSSIATSLNKKAPYVHLRKGLLYIIYVFQVLGSIIGFRKTLSRATIYSLVNTSIYSSSAVQETLDFSFQPLQATIERVAQAYVKTKKNQ